MKTSQTISKISAALLLAQKEMSNAIKESVNPYFKNRYADLNSVREAILPALNKHGISCLQPTIYEDGKSFVQTLLLHESGEYISSLTEIICNKANDAQSHGSGVTYARRYGLQSMCNIGSDDDDGNAASAPAPAKGPEKAWLNKGTDEWKNAVNALLKGTHTIEDVKKKYSISKPNETELITLTTKKP